MNMYKARFEPQWHMCKVNSSRDWLWWVQPHTHTRRSNGGKSLSRSDWCTYLRNREWKRKREKLGRILREDRAKWEESKRRLWGKLGRWSERERLERRGARREGGRGGVGGGGEEDILRRRKRRRSEWQTVEGKVPTLKSGVSFLPWNLV